MIRRITAFVFVLLANIVFLVHAVISHHYHHNQICIEVTHCKDHNSANNHDFLEHNHDNESKSSSSVCILNHIVVIPSSQVKIECNCISCNDSQSHNFLYTMLQEETRASVPVFRLNAPIPVITSSYNFYVTTSLGLRAPPLV